jgi:hypothetical protein
MYHVMMFLALLPAQNQQSMLGPAPQAETPKQPVAVPEAERPKQPAAPRPAGERPAVGQPLDPIAEATLRVMLDWFDGMDTLDELPEGERDQAYQRLLYRLAQRHRLSPLQVQFIASRFEYEPVARGLRVWYTDDDPPVKVGLARVGDGLCQDCEARVGKVYAVTDPHAMRPIDDQESDEGHDTKDEHDRLDRRSDAGAKVENAVILTGLTKVQVLEIIKPKDQRYNNYFTWVRASVRGNILFVQAYGLINCRY